MSEVLMCRDTEIYEYIHKHTHRDGFVSFLMTLNVLNCGGRDSQCTLLWEILTLLVSLILHFPSVPLIIHFKVNLKSKLIIFLVLIHIPGFIANDSSVCYSKKRKLFALVILHQYIMTCSKTTFLLNKTT